MRNEEESEKIEEYDEEDRSADIESSSTSSRMNVFKRKGGNLMLHMSEGHSQGTRELEEDAVITP